MQLSSNVFVILDATVPLIVGLSVGFVALIGLAVLLYFTLFAHMILKKKVREAERKFEYLHALLMGQDSQYIKRIEIISQTNLVYCDIHLAYSKRFKEIRDNSDSFMQTEINRIRDLVDEHNYKSLRIELPHVKEELAEFEAKVNGLNDDLKTVIKPEEECHQISLQLKERLRQVKQDYYVKQTELFLVADSFEKVFSRLDEVFHTFEDFVDSGHYEEAKETLKTTPAIIDELSRDLAVLPDLCISIQSVLPDKINSLRNRYETMIDEGYPLFMIMPKERTSEMSEELEVVTRKVQSFKLAGIQDELDGISAEIEEYFDAFEKEKVARVKFENECEGIYQENSLIEQKNIRLMNAIPDIKKAYAIPAEEQAKVDGIKALISKASATKRNLDTYIHSADNQPYTVLVEKMYLLRDEAQDAERAIQEFNDYLQSLKSDSENALRQVAVYYEMMQSSEIVLRKINISSVTEEYSPRIAELYQTIDKIFNLLYTRPIDVVAINSLVEGLMREGDDVCSGIKKLYDSMIMADAAILMANRERKDFSQMNVILQQTEKLYFAGQFETCYEDTRAAIQRLRFNE
ncbi:MAG: septation ring formation regulator EzrA [Bacilli bacterium]|nr:septation ring formation regulator EzrA [Bacilli bacterium]